MKALFQYFKDKKLATAVAIVCSVWEHFKHKQIFKNGKTKMKLEPIFEL